MPPFTILQVCMGNICRSPMAERLLVARLRSLAGDQAESLVHVHGAGTGGWHVGDRMDPQAAKQVTARGGDPSTFRARKLLAEHIEASDLILTATGEQVDFVVGLVPDAAGRTFVLGEFGRLLGKVTVDLPGGHGPDAVYARGTALVEAVHAVRGGNPPLPTDDLDDPWGRADNYFGRVADEIEETIHPLAEALLGR